MKPEKLFKLIGDADENFVSEAAEYPQKAQRNGEFLLRFAAAACLMLVIGGTVWFTQMQDAGTPASEYEDVLDFVVYGGDEDYNEEYVTDFIVHDATLLVANFLAEYPSVFGFVMYGEDGGGVDISGRPSVRFPLVRYVIEDGLFWDLSGYILDDVPFIRRGIDEDGTLINTHVATSFKLYDLGADAPVVGIRFNGVQQQHMDAFWVLYQFVNGEFIQVNLQLTPSISRSGLFTDNSGHPYAPEFFRSEDGRLFSFDSNLSHEINPQEGLRHFEFNYGVLQVIEELPEGRDGIMLTSVRLQDMEDAVRNLLENRFGIAYETHIWEWEPPSFEFGFSIDEANEIIRSTVDAFNDIAYVFNGQMMVSEEMVEYNGQRYMVVRDRRMWHLQSVQDIRDMLDAVFTRNGAILMHEMLDAEIPFFRDIGSNLTMIFHNDLQSEWPLLPTIIDGIVEVLNTGEDRFVASVKFSQPGVVTAFEAEMFLSFIQTDSGWRIQRNPFGMRESYIEEETSLYRSFVPQSEIPVEYTPLEPVPMTPGISVANERDEHGNLTENAIREREERERRAAEQREREPVGGRSGFPEAFYGHHLEQAREIFGRAESEIISQDEYIQEITTILEEILIRRAEESPELEREMHLSRIYGGAGMPVPSPYDSGTLQVEFSEQFQERYNLIIREGLERIGREREEING
ncbi:MAG: hypothetical protein FWE27_05210 [Defluviitaleaceae bacterium]|nr:hypothetical protein [Defluviitaleaceae bacterium]